MRLDDFHRIVVRNDPATGLRAIFAIHDLTLGPALGGVRRWVYRSDDDALADAVRLARGMTRKNALAGLPFGGGKSVILAPPAPREGRSRPTRPITEAELVRFGQWIEELGGDYVAAEDMGMRVADLQRVATATAHVSGIGRCGRGGDPGPKTALGVFIGLRVAAERLGYPCLRGVRIAVQGLGSVGMALCERLHDAGAELTVADIDAAKVACAGSRFQATAMDNALEADADIVAPCALGGAITPKLAETMPAKAIVGSANNQLACAEAAWTLKKRGILHAPDYVVNAGGVISAGLEYLGRDGFEEKVREIGPRLGRIFAESAATGKPESAVAEAMAQATLSRPRLSRVA